MAIGVTARTAFSLFFPPIINEFGWERGVTAVALSFGFLIFRAGGPVLGRVFVSRASPPRGRAGGGRHAAGAPHDATMASLSDDWRHGWRGQRVSRVFRAIAVFAELVQ